MISLQCVNMNSNKLEIKYGKIVIQFRNIFEWSEIESFYGKCTTTDITMYKIES